jgi:hypothetical protein
MLRDNLAGLIEPMIDRTGLMCSVVIRQRHKQGVLQVNRLGKRRPKAILAPTFSLQLGRQAEKAKMARFRSDQIYTNGKRCFSISG